MKIRMATLAALILIGAGCGATVHSTMAENANLGQYHTYAFATPKYRIGQTESVAEQDLRTSLRNALAQKGLVEAAPGQQPDFLVTYHVKEQQRLDVQNVGYGYGWGWGPTNVYEYTQGTLVVDFVDPRTNQAFWRGTASDVVQHPESPDPRKIDKAVSKLIRQYPSMMASAPRPVM